MVEPRLLINSSSDVAEYAKIRCTEIVTALWPTKPKARAFQIAHRILPNMAKAFGLAMKHAHAEWCSSAANRPAHHVAFITRQLIRQERERCARCGGELSECIKGRSSDRSPCVHSWQWLDESALP